MITGFPHNIRIRLARLKIFFVLSYVTLLDLAISGCNSKLIGPILFLYYEDSLVSSNLNSNLLRFHCAHPTPYTSLQNTWNYTRYLTYLGKFLHQFYHSLSSDSAWKGEPLDQTICPLTSFHMFSRILKLRIYKKKIPKFNWFRENSIEIKTVKKGIYNCLF